jgi:hypothetical protein
MSQGLIPSIQISGSSSAQHHHMILGMRLPETSIVGTVEHAGAAALAFDLSV